MESRVIWRDFLWLFLRKLWNDYQVWFYLRKILRQRVSLGSLNTNNLTHPPQNTRQGLSSNFANRNSLTILLATSTIESVINVNELSSKEPVVRCVQCILTNTSNTIFFRSITLINIRGLVEIIAPFRGHGRNSPNQVMLKREWLADEVLLSFSSISVLIFDKIALQWMKQYVLFKVQFDFAFEVWFSIYGYICLFDLSLYVRSTIFQLNRDGSSWVEPVLS